MSKQEKIDLNRNFNSKKKCSSCGIVSNDVNNSVILNKLLCIECLKDAIVGVPKDK